MNIVVLGAGTVGTSIAELLCQHRHSVTVIDHDPEKTARLDAALDVRTITGSACQASVLFQAQIAGADFCLAVTGVDEVNLIAASIAKEMGAHRTMARVFAPVFQDTSTFDYRRHFGIDRLLSLEYLSAIEFARAIRNPGALAMENLARGEIEMQDFNVDKSSRYTGIPLRDVTMKNVRIGLITRDGQCWIAGADDRLELGDRVTVVGTREKIDEVASLLQKKRPPKKTVVIAGGGETGYQLARSLEGPNFSIVVLEVDVARCDFLASRLKNVTVAQADATRKIVLQEERVGASDVFVSCLSDDEECIMVSVEAIELGAPRVMSRVDRPDYANVVGKLGIDVTISPREVTAKQVLGFLNTGAVVSRTQLVNCEIEILELEVAPDSAVTQHLIAEVNWPDGCLIAALTRDEFVRLPDGQEQLRAGDTVVALVETHREKRVAELFQ